MIGRVEYEGKEYVGEVVDDGLFVSSKEYEEDIPLAEAKILPPCKPTKLVGVGLNYYDHAKEMDMESPLEPILFLKPPSAMIAHEEKIVYPKETSELNYEAELAIVIGKRCRNIEKSQCSEVVMGYTCVNDITARDLQKRDGQWTRAKSFDTFAPLGPFIQPIEGIPELKVRCRVNGKTVQDGSTKNMIFDVCSLVEFISKVMTLESGDVIMTGTPAGIGTLERGDVVEVDIEKLAPLKNEVV
ncbi:MAG: fumarylacetoacetate hydrolase family protein [Methermicoccaceae archaeon]